MAEYNCGACNDLRESAPNFVLNGVTNAICTSLENDTGFNTSNSNTNCDDMHDANDCLIGNLEDEVEAYDVCDWKDFIKKLIPNLYTVLKGLICWACGLSKRVAYLECVVEKLKVVKTMNIGEENVYYNHDWLEFRDTGASVQITGNAFVGYMTGSLRIKEGADGLWSKIQNGGNLIVGGYLLYEYRIKNSDFDVIRFWNTNLDESGTGVSVHAHVYCFQAGTHPLVDEGSGYRDDVVPDGYTYIQVRLVSVADWGRVTNAPHDFTLTGLIPYRLRLDADC